MKSKIVNRIDDVISRFDFFMVHEIMKMMNWTWGNCSGVPSPEEIEKRSRALLADALMMETSISTGGLKATYSNKAFEELKLEFIPVKTWSAFDSTNKEYFTV